MEEEPPHAGGECEAGEYAADIAGVHSRPPITMTFTPAGLTHLKFQENEWSQQQQQLQQPDEMYPQNTEDPTGYPPQPSPSPVPAPHYTPPPAATRPRKLRLKAKPKSSPRPAAPAQEEYTAPPAAQPGVPDYADYQMPEAAPQLHRSYSAGLSLNHPDEAEIPEPRAASPTQVQAMGRPLSRSRSQPEHMASPMNHAHRSRGPESESNHAAESAIQIIALLERPEGRRPSQASLQSFKNAFLALNESHSRLETALEGSKLEIKQLKLMRSKAGKASLPKLERELKQCRAEVAENKTHTANAQRAQHIAEQKLKEFMLTTKQLQTLSSQLERERDSLKCENEALNEERKALKLQNKEFKDKNAQMNAVRGEWEGERDSTRSTLKKVSEEKKLAAQRANALDSRCKDMRETFAQMRTIKDSLQKEKDRLEVKNKELVDELKTAKERTRNADDRARSFKETNNVLKEVRAALEADNERLRLQVAELLQEKGVSVDLQKFLEPPLEATAPLTSPPRGKIPTPAALRPKPSPSSKGPNRPLSGGATGLTSPPARRRQAFAEEQQLDTLDYKASQPSSTGFEPALQMGDGALAPEFPHVSPPTPEPEIALRGLDLNFQASPVEGRASFGTSPPAPPPVVPSRSPPSAGHNAQPHSPGIVSPSVPSERLSDGEYLMQGDGMVRQGRTSSEWSPSSGSSASPSQPRQSDGAASSSGQMRGIFARAMNAMSTAAASTSSTVSGRKGPTIPNLNLAALDNPFSSPNSGGGGGQEAVFEQSRASFTMLRPSKSEAQDQPAAPVSPPLGRGRTSPPRSPPPRKPSPEPSKRRSPEPDTQKNTSPLVSDTHPREDSKEESSESDRAMAKLQEDLKRQIDSIDAYMCAKPATD